MPPPIPMPSSQSQGFLSSPTPFGGLVDGNGKPFDRYDDFAVPFVSTFAGILSGAYRTYYHDRFDEALKHERESALVMRRDCFLQGLMRERIEGTASLKWHLEPEDNKDKRQLATASSLTTIIQHIPRIKRIVRKLLDAIWYGRYGVQVKWGWREVAGQRCLTILKHVPVNGDKIGYSFDGTPYLLINTAVGPQQVGGEVIQSTLARAVKLTGDLRNQFLIHNFEPDDADFFEGDMAGAIGGVGIRSRIFWLDWLKREYVSWVVDLFERVGLGLVIIYYDRGNPKAKAEADQVAHTYSRRAVITIPRDPTGSKKDSAIEIIESPTAGAKILLEMQQHIESIIERYIVGQTLSHGTEGSGLGGTGVARMHSQTKAKIIAYDAGELAETLTGNEYEPGLVNTIQKWTFPGEDYLVRWVFDLEDFEPEKKLMAAKTIVDMGGAVKESEVLPVVGFTIPEDGDIVYKQQIPVRDAGMPEIPSDEGDE